jgi:hypothetical protein
MANDYYIHGDEQSYLQSQIEQDEQEYELFIHELQTLGVKNVNCHNGIRNIRNRQINQPTQHEPSRNIADSSGKEAAPF